MTIPFYAAHSSNYSVGRGTRSIKYVTIHHIAGTPTTLRHMYQDPKRDGSAHYGVFPSKVEQYVKEKDTAWTNGNFQSNQESITIETYGTWLNGYKNDNVLAQLKLLLADIYKRYPNIKMTFHQDVSDRPTACPGELRENATNLWNEVKGGEMKVTTKIANVYYRFYLGSGVSDWGKKNAVGEMTPNQLQDHLIKSKAYTGLVKDSEAGKLKAVDFLPKALRDVYKDPSVARIKALEDERDDLVAKLAQTPTEPKIVDGFNQEDRENLSWIRKLLERIFK